MAYSHNNLGKNTVIMYCRMAVIVLINLFTVRLVIKSLGEIDYGIYDVVAGIVSLLASISSILSATCHRYFTFYIGRNEPDNFTRYYSATIVIYAIFSIAIILLGEVAGAILMPQLDIPIERLSSAKIIFQFAILSFAISMMQSPFNSVIVAFENMGTFAILSILECILKFTFACLMSIVPFDRLIYYGGYLLLISVFMFFANYAICKHRYSGCNFISVKDKTVYRELLSFSGWTLFGSLAGISLFQISSILVNIFFGPIVTAARAIALQVYSALNSFMNNFLLVIKPPLIKRYANEDFSGLNSLFNFSNKIILYSFVILAVPLIFEMDTVLSLWLNVCDSQTVSFSKVIIFYVGVMSLGMPITYIMQATGEIKKYFIYVEVFTILCAPVIFIMFKLGFDAIWSFRIMVIAAILSHIVRIICLRINYPAFEIRKYFTSFLFPAIVVTAICCVISFYVRTFIDEGILRFIIVSGINMVSTIIFAYLIGLDSSEKIYVIAYIHKIIP